MDNLGSAKAQPPVRKVKKKQGKDEMDRLRQAEKKKRRMEKALATSAAIRSELEKKKQKKKEEQQRLDEEGAAIAEAVALHVLIGEDSEDSHKIALNKYGVPKSWSYGRNASSSYLAAPNCSLEGIGWLPPADAPEFSWGSLGGSSWLIPSRNHERSHYNMSHASWAADTGLSAGLIAAQAVSSLHIREDSHLNAVSMDRMLRG
ncbi:hypothetical protein SAY87_020349 [Trapa incisa]|uniref:Uncharacterized protein n=1 Tax=Trapa incisa TaxID=236973 RepID=A0AAN7Q488_9MYRT|nr:hypothetical protein SAY87_020349 [Trapa incisa]